MTSGNKWRDEKRAKRTLSPLNEATTARFRACEKAGGHVPSKRTVERDHGGRLVQLKLCRSCGVPIVSSHGWMRSYLEASRKGREREHE